MVQLAKISLTWLALGCAWWKVRSHGTDSLPTRSRPTTSDRLGLQRQHAECRVRGIRKVWGGLYHWGKWVGVGPLDEHYVTQSGRESASLQLSDHWRFPWQYVAQFDGNVLKELRLGQSCWPLLAHIWQCLREILAHQEQSDFVSLGGHNVLPSEQIQLSTVYSF